MSEYGLRDDECIWVDRLDTAGSLAFDAHSHLKAQLLWAARGQIAASVGDRRWIPAPTQALEQLGELTQLIPETSAVATQALSQHCFEGTLSSRWHAK